MAMLDAPRIVTSRIGARRLLHARALPRDRAATTRCARRSRCTPRLSPRGRRGVAARSRGRGLPGRAQVVDAAQGPVSYLVVNGDESEPATFKDHLLMERDPHQLVEGVVIAA